MDIFKIFPPLLLDLLSKFVPGSIFLFVFRNRYLPPTDLILQIFEPPSLSAELRSYGTFAVFVVSSYLIGVFIALASNAADIWRTRSFWQPRIQAAPDSYVFSADQPANFLHILRTAITFSQYIEYCRVNVAAAAPAIAFALEKYRTLYRLFFGLLVLSLLVPAYMPTPQALYSLPAVPLLLYLSHKSQKRYLLKSIQLFALHERNTQTAKQKSAED